MTGVGFLIIIGKQHLLSKLSSCGVCNSLNDFHTSLVLCSCLCLMSLYNNIMNVIYQSLAKVQLPALITKGAAFYTPKINNPSASFENDGSSNRKWSCLMNLFVLLTVPFSSVLPLHRQARQQGCAAGQSDYLSETWTAWGGPRPQKSHRDRAEVRWKTPLRSWRWPSAGGS